MADVDWSAIKAEYIAGNDSYQALSDKYGISFRTLSQRGVAEGWVRQRKAYRERVVKNTVKKVGEKQAAENAKKLLRLQKAADDMASVIEGVLKDEKQFHRHLVGAGEAEVVYKKADTKAIRDITVSMRELASLIRNVYDIPTRAEQQAMDIAGKRLQLEERKAEKQEDEDNELRVTFLAPEAEEWAE